MRRALVCAMALAAQTGAAQTPASEERPKALAAVSERAQLQQAFSLLSEANQRIIVMAGEIAALKRQLEEARAPEGARAPPLTAPP